MAWFRCMVGGGNALELIVTCSSQFAGKTITCTDGTSTLTATCPSSSPYEITFKLPNYGTWTVSGVISGQTYSESIIVQPYELELKSNIDLSVDVYSAANDTVSYTGLDGQTHTITTDSNGHASAIITIDPNGSTYTFLSSVAKNTTDLSSAYSKTIALTSTTSSIYIMPDHSFYWYGYGYSDISALASQVSGSNNVVAPALNKFTNYYKESLSNSSTATGDVVFNSRINQSDGLKKLIAITKSGSAYSPNQYSSQIDMYLAQSNTGSVLGKETALTGNTVIQQRGSGTSTIGNVKIIATASDSGNISGYPVFEHYTTQNGNNNVEVYALYAEA